MYTSLFNLAYIDPGSGSLIIQVLIAILVGVGVAFRNVRMAVMSVILKLFGKKQAPRLDEKDTSSDDSTRS